MCNRHYYSTLVDEEYSLLVRRKLKHDDIVICNEYKKHYSDEKTTKRFAVLGSPLLLFRSTASLTNEHRCDFEIIFGEKFQKIYADIDIELVDDSFDDKYSHTMEEKVIIATKVIKYYIDSLLKLKPCIKMEDIMVFSSHSNIKRSFHIVVDRWCVQSAKINNDLFEEIMKSVPDDVKKYYDKTMYKSSQQFRLFLSTKYGKLRQKIIDPDFSTWTPTDKITDTYTLVKEVFLSSLVSVTDTCQILPVEMKERIKYISSKDINNDEYKAMVNAFNNFSDKNSFEIGKVSGSFLLLKRKKPSFCELCKRKHEADNPFLFVGPKSGDIYLYCRRGEGSTKIGNLNDSIQDIKPEVFNIPRLEDLKPMISTNVTIEVKSFIDSGIMSLNANDSPTNNYDTIYDISRESTPDIIIEPKKDVILNENEIMEIKPVNKTSKFRKNIEKNKSKWRNKIGIKKPEDVFNNQYI